ncbi:Imm49 family immunity protein [Streptomyces sp. SudanB52_2052]|uniref:Imm49 family immunity protein n=1 Tax=Streptomyces sp. SudanB52_2052 TaxID=3035276 RepID=UPI003F553953
MWGATLRLDPPHAFWSRVSGKQYWSEEDRALSIPGLVALAPLAMACLAHDAGIPVEVESEYLPAVLIDRNWCGEFPT